MTTFAALGIVAGIVTLACGRQNSLRVTARLCLGLSCLFAIAACGELWLSLQGQESALDMPRPSAWGALWVHALALLVEWWRLGLADAGQRVLAAWLLAGTGVLFLGIGLGAWAGVHLPTEIACPNGTLAIDATAPSVRAIAAFGLALVPLAGIALRLVRPAAPPLSAAAASVVVATWLQPILPALGWLPLSLGAGAAPALLIITGLIILGLTSVRGPWMTGTGLAIYFALGVGGCLVLGIL